MKPYTLSIDINRPRDEVIAKFDDADNLPKWQTGLQSFEHLRGEPGQPGATSKLVYQNGRHRIELIETIDRRDLPDAFDGTYSWGGGRNTLKNRFIETGPNSTRWESTCAYQFDTIMLKLMGTFAPGMFRRQNMLFLKNFKAFCEDGRDVRDP